MSRDNDVLICDECGEPYFIHPVSNTLHHVSDESPDGIDHEADSNHLPYRDGGGNTVECPECGEERGCDEDGEVMIGEACPHCGNIQLDQDSLTSTAGRSRFSGAY